MQCLKELYVNNSHPITHLLNFQWRFRLCLADSAWKSVLPVFWVLVASRNFYLWFARFGLDISPLLQVWRDSKTNQFLGRIGKQYRQKNKPTREKACRTTYRAGVIILTRFERGLRGPESSKIDWTLLRSCVENSQKVAANSTKILPKKAALIIFNGIC